MTAASCQARSSLTPAIYASLLCQPLTQEAFGGFRITLSQQPLAAASISIRRLVLALPPGMEVMYRSAALADLQTVTGFQCGMQPALGVVDGFHDVSLGGIDRQAR